MKKKQLLGVMARPPVFGTQGHLALRVNSEASRRCKCVVAAGTVPCSSTLRSQAGTKGYKVVLPSFCQTSFRWFLGFRNHPQ